MLYISPWAGFEPKTSVVIGTDCIGSCKSNYHTITPTTAPVQRGIELYITNLVMTRNFKTVMVNNYTNINTTNNHLWPQIFERKKDQYLWRWRFRFCFIFFYLFFIFIFIYFFFFFCSGEKGSGQNESQTKGKILYKNVIWKETGISGHQFHQ